MTAQATQAQETEVPRERIAELAYELWVNRGSPIGSDQADWFEAEATLKAMMSPAPQSQIDPEEGGQGNPSHRKARRAT